MYGIQCAHVPLEFAQEATAKCVGTSNLIGAASGLAGNIPVILLSNANLIVNLLARCLTAAINDNYIVTNLRENRVNW